MGLDRVATVELDLSNLGGAVPVSGGGSGLDTTAVVFDIVSSVYTTTTPKQSSWFDWSAKEGMTLEFEMVKANTPTDITIEVLTASTTSSPTTNGSVHTDFMGDYTHTQASVGAGIEETVIIRGLKAQAVAIRVTASGVDGSNTFTISGMKAY